MPRRSIAESSCSGDRIARRVRDLPTPLSLMDWRRALRNVLSNWASFAVGGIVSFALSPFIVHTLGDATYGAWVLLGSLVGYLGLLELGTRGAVTKYVATYHAAHRHDEAAAIASTALLLFGGLGLVAILLSGVLALLVSRAFQVPAELVGPARIALILGGLNVSVSLVSGVFGGIVAARQRFDALNAINILLLLGQALAIVLVLRQHPGLVGLAIIQLIVSIIRAVVSAWLSLRLYPELRLRAGAWGAHHLRTIMSFGLSTMIIHAAGVIINYTDALVIGALLPVAMITFFTIGATITEQVRSIIAGISHIVPPMVGVLEGQRRMNDVGTIFMQAARFATITVLPILVTLELRGASFIGLWMGQAYAGLAGSVVVVLSASLWAFAGYQVMTATMMGINRHRGLISIFIGEAAANLVLSIVLAPHLGVVGVACGTALPRLVVSLVAGPLYVRRHLGVPLRSYYVELLLRPVIGMIPFALGIHATELWWPAANLLVFFSQILLMLPLAVLGAWAVVLTSRERQALAGALALPGCVRARLL